MDSGNALYTQRQQEVLLALLNQQGLLDASPEKLANFRAHSFGRTLAGEIGRASCWETVYI